jgi:hypothetical protein
MTGHGAVASRPGGACGRQTARKEILMKKFACLFLASAIGAGGCGSPAGLVPVSGKVLYRGEPAAGAVVYFHRQAEPGSPSGTIPCGVVEDDGRFSLSTDGLGNGARPGSYTVLVEWRDEKGDGVVPVPARGKAKLVKRSRVRSGPDRLKGRYLDIGKPLLHTEVVAGTSTLPPFELTD